MAARRNAALMKKFALLAALLVHIGEVRCSDALSVGGVLRPAQHLVAEEQSQRSLTRPTRRARRERDGVFPEERGAGLLSRASFQWLNPLFKTGRQRYLEVEDLWRFSGNANARARHDLFQPIFDEEMERLRRRELAEASKSNGTSALQQAQMNGEKASSFLNSPLFRALIRLHKKDIIVSGVLRFFNTLVQFLPPLLLGKLLQKLEVAGQGVPFDSIGSVKLAAALFLVMCSKTFTENAYFWILNRMSMLSRSEITSAVTEKMLRLSPSGAGDKSGGQAVTTLVQMDASRVESVLSQMHVTWDGLFQIIGNIALLVRLLGPSVGPGLGILFAIVPLNLWSYRKLAQYRTQMLSKTDERVRLTSEALSGIQVLKMQNWEPAASTAVERARHEELRQLRKSVSLRAALVAILTAAPSIVTVVILSLYSKQAVLEPSRVFTALTLLNNLRFPLIFYPTVLSSLAEGRASLRRFHDFFSAEETEKHEYVHLKQSGGDSGAEIYYGSIPIDRTKTEETIRVVKDSIFYWTPSSNVSAEIENSSLQGIGREESSTTPMLLRNVDIKATKGQVIGIVGSVGTGKSSLLAALAGEMRCARGGVTINVPAESERQGCPPTGVMLQRPWVPAGTIREIIVSGRNTSADFDEDAYIRALEGSGLVQDLAAFPDGDATLVASGGKSLSGGQRARVSLARALYSNSALLLLDDPLAALDADVAAQVWRRGILDAARRQGRTVFISLNNPQLAAQCDQLVVMSRTSTNGAGPVCESVFAGEWKELARRGLDPNSQKGRIQLLKEFGQGSMPYSSALPEVSGDGGTSKEDVQTHVPSNATESIAQTEKKPSENVADERSKDLSEVEEVERGRVKLLIYKTYLKALGSLPSLLVIGVAYLIANSCTVLLNYAISAWSGDSAAGYPDPTMQLGDHRMRVVGCALLLATLTFYRSLITMTAGLKASVAIHTTLLKRVMDASMGWHFRQRRGSLLTNFSRDLDQIDQTLPGQLGMLVSCVLQIGASLGAISSVTPSFAAFAPFMALVYLRTMNTFRSVARELKRLEPAARAPLLTQVSEALAGVRVLRVYGGAKNVLAKNYRYLEKASSAQVMAKAADRWLSVRLEILGNVVVAAAALLAIFSAETMFTVGGATAVETARRAGLSGLSISTAMGITGLLSWTVRTLAETESQMSAVERVVVTTNGAPTELAELNDHRTFHKLTNATDAGAVPIHKTKISEKDLILSGWPWTGSIEFRNVSFRYAPDQPLVLKDVSFEIRPGERIGIVGRTGSGKSTILAALFRLYPIESGEILIDQVNIADVSLETLRNALAIIPQDPYVFEGRNIVDNVRPTLAETSSRRKHRRQCPDEDDDQSTTQQIWAALEASQLAKAVQALPDGERTILNVGGSPLSAGQVQLLCLARAFFQVLPVKRSTSGLVQTADESIQSSSPSVNMPKLVEQVSAEALPSHSPRSELSEFGSGGDRSLERAALVRSKAATEQVCRRRKILLMDEATSAVDVETEQLISRAIEHVANPVGAQLQQSTAASAGSEGENADGSGTKVTVLAIAHRLATVLGSDKVLVLDQGRVAEFGPPSSLLSDPAGRLRALLKAAKAA